MINFYLYYFITIVLFIFISNGLETLFDSTSKVIKYHNYPDILKRSCYKLDNILTRFFYAGYSGLIALSNFFFYYIINIYMEI